VNPVFMTILLFLSMAMFIGTLADRYWLMRAGENQNMNDRPWERFKSLMIIGFGQQRLLYKRWAGLMHVTIFFGFLVIFTRTATLVGRGFSPDFHLPLLGGSLGLVYALFKDTFAVLVLLAIMYAIWRRLVVKPSRLHLSFEALIVLVWIAALMPMRPCSPCSPTTPKRVGPGCRRFWWGYLQASQTRWSPLGGRACSGFMWSC